MERYPRPSSGCWQRIRIWLAPVIWVLVGTYFLFFAGPSVVSRVAGGCWLLLAVLHIWVTRREAAKRRQQLTQQD